ncbi:MAG: NAD-dependent 4,6-dehydratase LegB [Bacteroidales bacterium]|nr:NAD-dependent 4,6-dehydratase LegB [Bacteroidales bacterium]
MKKVLITGAGGFIGSHLVEECVSCNLDVTAFVHYNSRNSWGWLEDSSFKNDIHIIQGDIRDFDSVSKAMKDCDTVFHLAALIGIPYSYISPMAYIKTNVEGTFNILESARIYNVPNVLVTSTSETYGSAQYVPIDELHPMVGQSPYSASKIGADQLAISYFRSFGLPVKIVRPFNTYGPRQSARAIIPTIITQILSGTKEIKLGNLTPTRDLNYVKDTVSGFMEIAKVDKFNGEIVNIGNNSEISVGDLVSLIIELLNTNVSVVSDVERVRPEKSEVERLYCDNSKLISSSPWKPKFDIRTGLSLTIEWLKQNIKYYKTDIYNV